MLRDKRINITSIISGWFSSIGIPFVFKNLFLVKSKSFNNKRRTYSVTGSSKVEWMNEREQERKESIEQVFNNIWVFLYKLLEKIDFFIITSMVVGLLSKLPNIHVLPFHSYRYCIFNKQTRRHRDNSIHPNKMNKVFSIVWKYSTRACCVCADSTERSVII